MPPRGRQANKRASKADEAIPKFQLLNYWNSHYINNVEEGVLVKCDVCDKWRLVKEYEEGYEVPDFFECSMWNIDVGEKGNCYIPQIQDDEDYTNESYTPGSIVWARWKGERWPAMVEDDPDLGQYCGNPGKNPEEKNKLKKYHVVFFGDEVTRCWIEDKKLEGFSIPSSYKMPFRTGRLGAAIEDAMEAKNMKKADRLKKYSFATRYGKKMTRPKNKDKKSTLTQFKTSKQDYAAGDLVWVKRKGHQRCPGMVTKDPAEKRFSKDLEADGEYLIVFFDEKASKSWIKSSRLQPFSLSSRGKMPLEEKKAIEEAKEAMKMTNQERLKKFSFPARNGKKRCHAESEVSEEDMGEKGERDLPNYGNHDNGSSTACKRKKISTSSQQNLHPVCDIDESRQSLEDGQSRICEGAAQQNTNTRLQRTSREMTQKSTNKDTDLIIVDQNNNKYGGKDDEISSGYFSDLSAEDGISDSLSDIPVKTNGDTEEIGLVEEDEESSDSVEQGEQVIDYLQFISQVREPGYFYHPHN